MHVSGTGTFISEAEWAWLLGMRHNYLLTNRTHFLNVELNKLITPVKTKLDMLSSVPVIQCFFIEVGNFSLSTLYLEILHFLIFHVIQMWNNVSEWRYRCHFGWSGWNCLNSLLPFLLYFLFFFFFPSHLILCNFFTNWLNLNGYLDSTCFGFIIVKLSTI